MVAISSSIVGKPIKSNHIVTMSDGNDSIAQKDEETRVGKDTKTKDRFKDIDITWKVRLMGSGIGGDGTGGRSRGGGGGGG